MSRGSSLPRLAVFCSGYGSNFEALICSARSGRLQAEIAVLVCDKPGAYAVKRAVKHQIPVVCVSPKLFASKPEYERFILRILKREQVDLVVLAGFMRILSPVFIRALRDRIVNIHPSYLPAFKGAHAIRDAFESKAPYAGVTVHLVVNQVDAGKILAQEKVSIRKQDTLVSLEKKIHELEYKLYSKVIGKYLDDIMPNSNILKGKTHG